MLKRLCVLIAAVAFAAGSPAAAPAANGAATRVSGIIVAVSGSSMLLQRRDGKIITVDLSEAIKAARVGVRAPHVPIEVYGSYGPDGTFHCAYTGHAGPNAQSWPADR